LWNSKDLKVLDEIADPQFARTIARQFLPGPCQVFSVFFINYLSLNEGWGWSPPFLS
jgi:hypothetical protein